MTAFIEVLARLGDWLEPIVAGSALAIAAIVAVLIASA